MAFQITDPPLESLLEKHARQCRPVRASKTRLATAILNAVCAAAEAQNTDVGTFIWEMNKRIADKQTAAA